MGNKNQKISSDEMLKTQSSVSSTKSHQSKRSHKKYSDKDINKIVNSIFNYMDRDSSGVLQKTQFAKAFSTIVTELGGEKPLMEDVEDVLYQLDTNGDGQISKSELKPLIESVIKLIEEENMALHAKKYKFRQERYKESRMLQSQGSLKA